MPQSRKNLTNFEKSLPRLLDEFRTALLDEIEVAKRNAASSAIPLSNGHRVGEQGGAFQYAFLIASVLNTPDDSPADLIVDGKGRMDATIVSVEGLRLVISVESDLGDFVPTARLQTDLTILMRKLIERIETNASSSNPAASRMLGKSPVSGSPLRTGGSPTLNESQMLALESALGRDLTAIWGPPGTGKTHTIGTIGQFLHGAVRTVLIVSHTNIAVDQAIKHIVSGIPGEHLERGAVIRVGTVRDDALKSGFPDVLLKRQVERHSVELVDTRDNLVSQKEELGEQLKTLQQKISMTEWVEPAQLRIQSAEESLNELHRHEAQLESEETTLAELEARRAQLLELDKRASDILVLRTTLKIQLEEKSRREGLLSVNAAELQEAVNRLRELENRVKIAVRITPLRQERAKYPEPEAQNSIIARLSATKVEAEKRLSQSKQSLNDAITLLEKSRRAGIWDRLWHYIPQPEEQEKVVTHLSNEEAALDAKLQAERAACEAAVKTQSRIVELDAELALYVEIGDQDQESAIRDKAQATLERLERTRVKIEASFNDIRAEIERLLNAERQLAVTITGDAQKVYDETHTQLDRFKVLKASTKSLRTRIEELRQTVSSYLNQLLAQLVQWGVIAHVPTGTEQMLYLARSAHETVVAQQKPSDLPAFKDKAKLLETQMQSIQSEIQKIDERLEKVEREIVTKASVVGATLTKAYLSDDIQARRFDTVILDEASMAPIPALWAAAFLSDKNLVIVGDFRQLPPIVLSDNELTKKWLGRDIFEVSGLKKLWHEGKAPAFFIPLNEQRRMLPEIAEVANVFYDGLLRTNPVPPAGLDELSSWYNTKWSYDNPVVLVDTGSLNAWVTSVVRNGKPSRLNFLSATVAVDLAEQLLLDDRPERPEGSPKRILIIAPYRPHAKLVSVLLRENERLRDEVIAGTAHSFQGSEADVVIFDLVADEPHFRVNLFMQSLDDQIMRLLNVALTRAKFRLFVLGDFSYCRSKGKKAFLGRRLLPFLIERFPCVDASQLFPEGLAAKAAKAQMTMLGGAIEPSSERLVVTQEDFFRLLPADLGRAKSRIIIYSPFITEQRLGTLMPQLQAATERGVTVFIITKTHSERSKSELSQIRSIESHLSEINVIVIHKMRMHEKLVFIDEDIIWSGSLNPLSFSNTQEVMERRKSKEVFEDYFKTLRLADLLSIQGKPESKCPICGAGIVAAEGADEPYYWRCATDDCFTRSIGQPYPFDGVLSCRTCNNEVGFGYWGEYPHWRCKDNPRHRQKIYRSHLRLPKMVALIPKQERSNVCRYLGIDNFDKYISHPRLS